MSTQVTDFLQEILNRLQMRSPKVFRVLQLIGGSLAFAGYIPSMLQRWFGVEVPGPTITMCEDIGKYAAGFFAAALLPVRTKPVAQTEEGRAITVTDENKLPFTSKVEEKKIEESKPPLEVIPEVPEPDKKENNGG